MDDVVGKIVESIKKKKKDAKIKTSYIKENIVVFINSNIYNPSFST